jgi:hypothetical protein
MAAGDQPTASNRVTASGRRRDQRTQVELRGTRAAVRCFAETALIL